MYTLYILLVYIFENLKHKKVTDGKVAYSGKVFSVCPHTHKRKVQTLCSPNIFSHFSKSNFASVFAHLFANGTKLKIHFEIKPLLIYKLRMQKTFLPRKSENDDLFCAFLCQ